MERVRWDVFCTVVDNLGDIGVCWRLSRNLALRPGLEVTLWVDDLTAFRRIEPRVLLDGLVQDLDGVKVRRWGDAAGAVPARVVIEGFGCALPDAYLQAMAASALKPVWINLEYLSAEPWVDGYHKGRSPHPRLPLTKHFYFPGFSAQSGGLLREPDLLARRDAWRTAPARIDALWKRLQLPAAEIERREALRISLFAYPGAPLGALLDTLAAGTLGAVSLLVPQGIVSEALGAWLGVAALESGTSFARASLVVCIVPFVEQRLYDELLWACDINFVRGEDSLVRALWAGRPMIWQIYPQEEGAHWVKLDAFLERYLAGAERALDAPLRRLWHAWNGTGRELPQAVGALPPLLRLWRDQSEGFARGLETHADLVAELVNFAGNVLE